MKNSFKVLRNALIVTLISCFIIASGCTKKEDNPIKFKTGTFPDTVLNLGSINSQFDDYNLNTYSLTGSGPVVFSSNRNSSGGQFDLVQGNITFSFDQTNGEFEITTSTGNDPFLTALLEKARTPGNDFGPYRFFSTSDGYEYLVLSSVNSQGNLDINYLRNRPQFNQSIPEIQGPIPVSILNSGSDDAYFSLDLNQDTAYFCSSRGGNFNIYLKKKNADTEMSTWFIQNPEPATPVDSLNSTSDDKCPMVMNRIMVFTSNRPGGIGGYDLYYSVFNKGRWGSPVNFGPGINTSYNEYRPVIGWQEDFTNYFLMFSSDRPGGLGGYDLYFTGVDFK
jgi:hypothetical protein